MTGRGDLRRRARVGLDAAGLDDFHRQHRAAAAHVGDGLGSLGDLAQPRQHDVADPAGPAGQVLLGHGLQRAERCRAGNRIAAERAAEAAGMHRVHQVRPAGHAGQRQPAGDPLRRGDQVRHDRLVIAGEPVTGAAQAALDLVGDQHDAVSGAELREPGQEPVRRDDEPALALDRLDQHRRDVVLADLGVDQARDHVQRLGRAAFRPAGPAQRVGHRDPVDLAGERAEPVLVRHVLGGQRHREVGAAVVGVIEDHDSWPPGGIPGDLDGVLHRLRAGVEQRRALLVITGSQPVELLADLHVPLVRGDHEAGMGEARHLLGDPLDDPLRAVAHPGDRDAGAEIDQRVAVDVDDHATAGRGDEDRQHVAEPPRDAAMAPFQQFPRRGPGYLGHDLAFLGQRRAACAGQLYGHTADNKPGRRSRTGPALVRLRLAPVRPGIVSLMFYEPALADHPDRA